MPQFPRLRALVAATLAAFVIVTIQPPVPSAAETPTPTASPIASPTASPTASPIASPGASPTASPVASPIASPTASPTASPIASPVASPTASPIASPVASPTASPIASPVAGESPVAVAPAATAETAAPAPAAASARKRAQTAPKADRVIAAAMAKRGRPWVYGATGPRAFDCSGLVTYAFRRAGVLAKIGSGRNRGGSSMLRWARARHLTRSVGHRGDIVVWGNGAHVGIYLGKGKAISTLTSGVRVHGLRVLNTPFTTFISTGLWVPGRALGVAGAVTKSTTVGELSGPATREPGD